MESEHFIVWLSTPFTPSLSSSLTGQLITFSFSQSKLSYLHSYTLLHNSFSQFPFKGFEWNTNIFILWHRNASPNWICASSRIAKFLCIFVTLLFSKVILWKRDRLSGISKQDPVLNSYFSNLKKELLNSWLLQVVF